MTQSVNETVPDPSTFDLASFIAEKATYARYKVTVHLAAEEANRSVQLADRIDELARQRESALKEGKERRAQVSLGETSPAVSRVEELNAQIEALAAERRPLMEKVQDSALTFVFAVTGRQVQARISERINALLDEADDNAPVDPEAVETRINRRLARNPQLLMKQTAVMMKELVVEVRNASGGIFPVDKLTEESLTSMLNVIPMGEVGRINETMGLALNGAQDFDRALDAGFPGGRAVA